MTGPSSTCSVVIPVRDDADELDRCLSALARQWSIPLEVLVVDNGSTEGSAAVAACYGATVLHKGQPGIFAAAATGYDAASGDLILRLDADSVPPRDWVARIVDAFDADPGLDALTGPGEFSAVPRRLRHTLTDWYWRAYFDRLRRTVGATPLFGSNLAMRNAAWARISDDVHRFDPEVHDDLDLSIHLVQAGSRLAIDRRLVVPVSARPLLHPFGLVGRVQRAAHTLALHSDRPRPRLLRADVSR